MNWKKILRSDLGLLAVISLCHILLLALLIGCSSTEEKREDPPQEIMLEVSLGDLPDTEEDAKTPDPGNLPPDTAPPVPDPQAEEKQRREAAEKQKQQELAEKQRKAAEERKKRETAEKQRKAAEERKKRETAEKKRKAAEERKKRELAEKQRREAAENRRKLALAEKQRREAERRRQQNSGVYNPKRGNFDPDKPFIQPKGKGGGGSGQDGNATNDYGQKLFRTIRDTWNVPPGIWVTEGNAATIELIIDRNGWVTGGRIISRSPNLQINQSVERLISDLKKKRFPQPPGGRSARLVFKMVSE